MECCGYKHTSMMTSGMTLQKDMLVWTMTVQTNFLKMPTWLDYWLSIIELLINKVMQDPIPAQNSRRAVPSVKGTTAEKIAELKRLKSSLRISAEHPKPDPADFYARLPRRVK